MERQSIHSPLETRRQRRFRFDYQKLEPLCQHLGITPENFHHLLNNRSSHDVQTHWFLEAIRESLPIEWGQTFQGHATHYANGNQQRHSHGVYRITDQMTGSIVIGADGVSSRTRREHQFCINKQFHYRYGIVYYGAGFHVKPGDFRRLFKPFFGRSAPEAAVVHNGARLTVSHQRSIHVHLPGHPERHEVAHLSLAYSKAASAEEFESFYGHKINQWRTPYIGYQHTSVILDKLRAEFGRLPDLFERAIDAIKPAGYHVKMLGDTIQIPPSPLPTRLESGEKSMPYVLVGDAADASPVVYDTFSMTRVCSEAVMLGEIIAQAWKTGDGRLDRVPQTFYGKVRQQWDLYRALWLKQWYYLHETLPGSLGTPTKITEILGDLVEDPSSGTDYEVASGTNSADLEIRDAVRSRAQHRHQLNIRQGLKSSENKPFTFERPKDKGANESTRKKHRNEPMQLAFTDAFVSEEEVATVTRINKFKPFEEDFN